MGIVGPQKMGNALSVAEGEAKDSCPSVHKCCFSARGVHFAAGAGRGRPTWELYHSVGGGGGDLIKKHR